MLKVMNYSKLSSKSSCSSVVPTMAHHDSTTSDQRLSRHAAVIGAGASGLVAARELRREGHSVVVFERGDQLGGNWVYTDEVDSDPLGLDPNRAAVHSSMYQSLRTNLPRELMGFRDYPFTAKKEDEQGRDPRRFPGHREVLMYLNDFAGEFGIGEMVRFETEVLFVGLVEGGGNKWMVKSKRKSNDESLEEVYDAVVVCCGHYNQPRVAEIPGITTRWKGKQIHSHNYRTPEPFRDKAIGDVYEVKQAFCTCIQVVILIGSSASAIDISGDIAGVAKEVHISSRSVATETTKKNTKLDALRSSWLNALISSYDNMWLHSEIGSVLEDGRIVFTDGSVVFADTIVHCTGYKYHYPFLETNGIVNVDEDDNRVGPLYKHIFPPALAPSLSFVGVPWMTVPFPNFELQSKWIARVLSNRVALPSKEEMIQDVRDFYSSVEASGRPKRRTHDISPTSDEYSGWLGEQCGFSVSEEWRKQMRLAVVKNHVVRPKTYHDEWDDQHLVRQAYEAFKSGL